MKRKCYRCKETKPIEAFYTDKSKSGGRNYECKECTKARVKKNHDPERYRDLHLQRNYGITLNDFDRMVLEQGGRCACCGTDRAGGRHNVWNVDHDHTTGEVRQLLCKNCNMVLGQVDDDHEHLLALIKYLERHKKCNSTTNS